VRVKAHDRMVADKAEEAKRRLKNGDEIEGTLGKALIRRYQRSFFNAYPDYDPEFAEDDYPACSRLKPLLSLQGKKSPGRRFFFGFMREAKRQTAGRLK
jgi:hypothetical protein